MSKQDVLDQIDLLAAEIRDEFGKDSNTFRAARVLYRIAATEKEEEEKDSNE